MIIGHLICQDGAGEILRCIESVYPVVDEFYVCDGGSTDGTLDILERFKDAYKLKIFKRKFDQMDKQRNFLLAQTPPDSWVITIDQDEKLSMKATQELREFIERIYIKPNSIPSVFMPNINLVDDSITCDPTLYGNINQIFYTNGEVVFKHPYHCAIGHQDHDYNIIEPIVPPFGFAVLHYARLDKQRQDRFAEDVKSGKREYGKNDWEIPIKSNLDKKLW